jgi:hypothetical protein
MFRIATFSMLVIIAIGLGGCSSSDGPVDARTQKVQDRLKPLLERVSKKQIESLKLRPEGENRFVGTAKMSDGVKYDVTATQEGGKLSYEAKSKDGSTILSGADVSIVSSAVAKKDLAAGTKIENVTEVFDSGQDYALGEQPNDVLLYNHLGLLDGKKMKNTVKKGDVVKVADIAEPDGTPWQQPQL